MKYFLHIILITLIASGLSSTSAYATSGACSYHSGVNCSAGANYSGNVTCNDGWVNSSVLFSDTDECKIPPKQCTYPTQPFCDLGSIEQQKQEALNQASISNIRTPDFLPAQQAEIENTYGLKYSSCQSQQSAYESQMDRYDSCINNQNKTPAVQITSSLCDISSNNYLKCRLDESCQIKKGYGSIFDIKTETCGPSRDERIDTQFWEAFNRTIATMPEYKDVVEPQIIKTLSLMPANANKTFAQIIIGAYGSQLKTETLPAPVITDIPVFSAPLTPINKKETLPVIIKDIVKKPTEVTIEQTTIENVIPSSPAPSLDNQSPLKKSWYKVIIDSFFSWFR